MIIDRRYRLLENMGSGPLGSVWRAQDLRSGNFLRIKLFQDLWGEDSHGGFGAVGMWRRRRLRHPNLLGVYDFGRQDDGLYMAGEFFQNASTLSEGGLATEHESLIWELLAQICLGLQALHRQGMAHGALKAENILFKKTAEGIEVKLADHGFGAVNLAPWNASVRSGEENENLQSTVESFSPQDDLFALGAVIYRLLTGREPFSARQIEAMKGLGRRWFSPLYPRELDPGIPMALQNLCLRLLAPETENRFQSAQEVLLQIERASGTHFSPTPGGGLANSIRFGGSVSRAKEMGRLLDLLPTRTVGGKTVCIMGGEGIGAGELLSLFRYEILGTEQYLFDFSCSPDQRDAFFALIKEYLASLPAEELAAYRETAEISTRMRSYLFGEGDGEAEVRPAKNTLDGHPPLMADFEFAKKMIGELARRKPVVFIIRNVEHLHPHSIDFINFLSVWVAEQPILILMSSDDLRQVKLIRHPVLIQLDMFTPAQSASYAKSLTGTALSEEFSQWLHRRSGGNPWLIREILASLAEKGEFHPGEEPRAEVLAGIELPQEPLESIYTRMSRLTSGAYLNLQKLSIVQTPISSELIRHICQLGDAQLYELLNEAKFNEILHKDGKQHYFTFAEAKKKFFEQCLPRTRKQVSQNVLQFFDSKKVEDLPTCRGLIEGARIAEDMASERRWLLRLYELYCQEHLQQESYDAIARVLRLRLEGGLELTDEEFAQDLSKFHRMLEFTASQTETEFLLKHQDQLPNSFEKFGVLGSLVLFGGDTKTALRHYERAEKLASTPAERTRARLWQGQIHARLNPLKLKRSLAGLELEKASIACQIKAATLMAAHDVQESGNEVAVKMLEEFLAQLTPSQEPDAMIELASLHNTLGELYSIQKDLAEAGDHFGVALNIWNSYNIRRHLAWIHNNLADLDLKQGLTDTGLAHAEKAFAHAKDRGNPLAMGRARLNQGEVKIKMGAFEEAETLLLEAQEIIKNLKAEKYLVSIERNLALAKSKIIGFGHYYNFIAQREPKLVQGNISQINPLVKTYFYYLTEIKNPKKLSRLILGNTQIDYARIHEQEFYHNALSLLAMVEGDYDSALKQLKLALRFAGQINNHYAMAVLSVLKATCHYGLGQMDRAAEILRKAKPGIQERHYLYWELSLELLELKLKLVDPSLGLRELLRQLNDALSRCQSQKYYQLEVQLRQMKIQLLTAIGAPQVAGEELRKYRQYLESITRDIDPQDRLNFLEVSQYNCSDPTLFKTMPMASRQSRARLRLNEILFDTSNVNSLQRVKFLIGKGINQLISPSSFVLMAWSEKLGAYQDFHSYNAQLPLPGEFGEHIENAFQNHSLQRFEHLGKNIAILPLGSSSRRVGFLVLSDEGELDYTPSELELLENIRAPLTAMLVRAWDYSELYLRMEKMNRLIELSNELMNTRNLGELEQGMVSAAIELTGATRGFLIKKDSEGNNFFQIQLDMNGQILSTAFGVSNTALGLCQSSDEELRSTNAPRDKRFEDSFSVQDYGIQSIFCAPILQQDYSGYLYLDNAGDSSREMYLNEEFTRLFLRLFQNAIQNSLQYSELIQKSAELSNLEQAKDYFTHIVSHEFNTPLFMLQSAVNQLKQKEPDLKSKQWDKIEEAVKKLSITVADVQTMNRYNLTQSLQKKQIDLEEILRQVHQQIEILTRERRLHIRVELEKDLPPLWSSWADLHLMIYNIVLNAVRFTNDNGIITIGARRSAVPQEKIEGGETLVIFVTDNGIGISQRRIREVFQKYYELGDIYAHKSGLVSYRSSGLGLGLAVSKRIAELHGGRIEIKSKENEGTSVFMILPNKKGG